MFSGSGSRVGLDIGSQMVKLVEIEKDSEGKKKLSRFALAKVDSGDEGKAAAIKKVKEESGIENNQVAVSVSGQSVIVRYIDLPEMSEEETRSAIKYEAEQHIPFNIDEVTLDFQILEKFPETKKMRVLLVAAKKDLINNQLALIKSAGFIPTFIDVDSFALINSFESQGAGEEVAALVNIGAQLTNINIISGGVPCFTRDVPLAGHNVTEVVKKSLDIDSEAAEKQKLEEGNLTGDSPLSLALHAALEDLTGEIRLSFDYCENQTLGKAINKVYVSGGGARLQGLEEFLSKSLGLPAQIWNPFKNLELNSALAGEELNKLAPLLAVAVGLALRED